MFLLGPAQHLELTERLDTFMQGALRRRVVCTSGRQRGDGVLEAHPDCFEQAVPFIRGQIGRTVREWRAREWNRVPWRAFLERRDHRQGQGRNIADTRPQAMRRDHGVGNPVGAIVPPTPAIVPARGSVTTKRLPLPLPALCATTEPPCASTSSLTTASPRPRPPLAPWT